MNELEFTYDMKISFDAPVTNQRFTVRCMPISDERQLIHDLEYEIYPNHSLETGVDSFGNHYVYGQSEEAHDSFYYKVKGIATTGLSDSEGAEPIAKLGRYRYPTLYTTPGKTIHEYFQSFQLTDSMSMLDQAVRMMQKLYQDFRYVPGSTSINTTAEEALILGTGVCQDYSHILISLCHLAGIPARYIVGMLLGEGASHAWVEIYNEGRWYALDPTNNLIVTDQHIKISKGRDYKDCLVNQGVFVGNAKQTQTLQVSVSCR